MLIKNYGRLWRRDVVHWGGGNLGAGNLGAIGEWNKGGADFREQVAIYILHDASYAPIYVGQTGAKGAKLFKRLAFHNRSLKMRHWEYFSWFGFRDVRENGELEIHPESVSISLPQMLDEFESLLILLLEPKKNRQSGRWKNVEEYYQMGSAEDWGYSTSDIIDHLRRIEKLLIKNA